MRVKSMDRILNAFWPLVAAVASILLGPGLLVAIMSGKFIDAAVCVLVLVPFWYVLLSAYLGRVLERRFHLSASDKAALLADMPMYSGTIWLYGRRRRQMLQRFLSRQGAPGDESRFGYGRLVILHRALELAFILELVLFVGVLLAEYLFA
jgi:hypothetical protein